MSFEARRSQPALRPDDKVGRTPPRLRVEVKQQHEIDLTQDGDDAVEAALAQARSARDKAGVAATPERQQALDEMNPAAQVAELDRRIAQFQLLDQLFSGEVQINDLDKPTRIGAQEALDRMGRYQKDVSELHGKNDRVVIAELIRAHQQMRDEVVREQGGVQEKTEATQPKFEQFSSVRPKGFGNTDWYILSIEPSGTYIVANRRLVIGDRRNSARDIVGEIRQGGRRDSNGVAYRNSEPLGFEMNWAELEQLCKR